MKIAEMSDEQLKEYFIKIKEHLEIVSREIRTRSHNQVKKHGNSIKVK